MYKITNMCFFLFWNSIWTRLLPVVTPVEASTVVTRTHTNVPHRVFPQLQRMTSRQTRGSQPDQTRYGSQRVIRPQNQISTILKSEINPQNSSSGHLCGSKKIGSM